MKPSLFAFFLLISLTFMYPAGVLAASDESGSRYFLDTDSAFWRGAMGARHVFPSGFSADLSDLQLGIARLAGLKPVPVIAFNVLAEGAEISPSPTPQTTPSQSVSWGVRTMLNDFELQQTEGGAGMLVAVLDTGIDREHPDLSRRVAGCYDLTDVVKGLIEDQCDDANGHGTHVAGVIAADGGPDGSGLYGFAPQASISAYRVCVNGGSCLSDDIAAAIRHATDAGVHIIVLSMGGESQSTLVSDAIAYAVDQGVLVIAGAGNDGPYEDSVDWPAREASVISVAAISNTDEPAEFSSRGLNEGHDAALRTEGDVELAAPGVNIESTYTAGGYAILSGTSMAAPHIAGLAALLWTADAEQPAETVRAQLRALARDIADTGDDAATGWGVPILVR